MRPNPALDLHPDRLLPSDAGVRAVARDLYEAIKADEAVIALLHDRNVKISVGKSFVLSIKTTHISAYK